MAPQGRQTASGVLVKDGEGQLLLPLHGADRP